MKKAYNGYLICYNPLNGSWWIEREGFCIGYAKDEEHAKRLVEELVS